MMENYETKSRMFLSKGEIAIGIKDTPDSQSVIDNRTSIGYILFHTRKDEGQHLFVVDSVSGIVGKDKIGDIYPNMNTTGRYIVVRFRQDFELPPNMLHSSKMPFEPKTRYDSQFSTLDALKAQCGLQ